jgi:hypothetical protein
MTVDATGSDDFDQLVSGQETATETSGKYFCVNVPDYQNTASSDEAEKQSYLRVGAAITDWTTEPGADLAALAYLVGTAGNATATEGGYALAEAENAVAALGALYEDISTADICDPYVDDQRERGTGNERPAGPGGHGLSPEERRAESAKLHTNVGWRDHTDGNRISTTRGDKVEVVYGNYKLIVMGRQSDTAEAMAWDVTGNHIQDFGGGTMPGASVTLEWVPDTTYGSGGTGGAWLLQNSTERVYQYSRNAGNFREEWWGDLLENYIGSENPEGFGTYPESGQQGHPKYRDEALGKKDVLAPPNDSTDIPRGNPTIIERTWATKIDSRTGSETLRVPDIHEETWADNTYSKTKVTKAYSTQWSEIVEDYLVAQVIVEGATALLHFRGFAGSIIDLYAGPKLQVEVSGSITLTAFAKFEASFGWSWGYHNMKDEMALLTNRVSLSETSLGVVSNALVMTDQKIAANKTDITSALRTEIDAVNTSIATTNTRIDTMDTHLGNISADVCNLIFMG